MNLLVAIDSFKGCATSKELNDTLLDSIDNPFITDKIGVPIADGGEGTLDAIYDVLGGKKKEINVVNLMGDPIRVHYLLVTLNNKKTVFIESSSVLGINQISPSKATILKASSYGLGKMVHKIITTDFPEVIYIALGGTGSSDGGLGFLKGLEDKEDYDFDRNPLYQLEDISVDFVEVKSMLKNIELIGLADVVNPYVGEMGFANFFGLQKGGDRIILKKMDELSRKAAIMLYKQTNIDISYKKGAGAAGGLGGAILSLGGRIESGFELICDLVQLDSKVKNADIIITGEGRIDGQTEKGKGPFCIAKLANKYNKPVFAICGTREKDIGILEDMLLGAFCIHLGPIDLESAMDTEITLKNLKVVGKQLVDLFIGGSKCISNFSG